MFDEPFKELLNQMGSLLPFFMTQAVFISKILLTVNILLSGIKYAVTKQGLKESLIKAVEAYILLMCILHYYPTILTGINSIVYKWAVNSTMTAELKQNIEDAKNNYEFWQDKTDPESYAYSDIIKKVEEIDGAGNVGYSYILDLQLDDEAYFSPNAFMRFVMLIFDGIWKSTDKLEKNILGWPTNILLLIFNVVACFAVLVCGILALLQYVAAALEFQFIMCVGVITLPGMCLNSTKFLTEKFFGCLLGFFMKLLFVTIAMQLTMNGYLKMMFIKYNNGIDQIIYIVVMSLWYLMICQNGPKLATSLLTGSPQMSLMEGVQAAGTFAAAAIGAGHMAKSGASAVHQGATKTAGTAAKLKGAYNAGKELNGGVKGGIKAAGASALNSVGETIQGAAHGLSQNLLQPSNGKKTSFGGTRPGTNRFSQQQKINTPNEKGEAKTRKEYLAERMREGENKELNRLVKKENGSSSGKISNSTPQPHQKTFTNVPQLPEKQQYQLPETPTRLALPPPQQPQLPPPTGGKNG